MKRLLDTKLGWFLFDNFCRLILGRLLHLIPKEFFDKEREAAEIVLMGKKVYELCMKQTGIGTYNRFKYRLLADEHERLRGKLHMKHAEMNQIIHNRWWSK